MTRRFGKSGSSVAIFLATLSLLAAEEVPSEKLVWAFPQPERLPSGWEGKSRSRRDGKHLQRSPARRRSRCYTPVPTGKYPVPEPGVKRREY